MVSSQIFELDAERRGATLVAGGGIFVSTRFISDTVIVKLKKRKII
jgi:hypothetical protein